MRSAKKTAPKKEIEKPLAAVQPKRNRVGLLYPALSLALVAAVFIGAVTAGEGVRKLTAYESLKVSLKEGDLLTAHPALDSVYAKLTIAEWVSAATSNFIASPPPHFPHYNAEQLFEIVSSVRRDDGNSARKLFKKFRNKELIDLLVQDGGNADALDEIQANIDIFTQELQHLAPPGRDRVAKQITKDKLRTDFRLVSQDFGEFLALVPEPMPENEDLPVYRSGTLKGLPRLTGLADNLEDPKALKSALSLAGGEVRLEGSSSPFQEFNEKVDAFREATQEIVDKLDALGLDGNKTSANSKAQAERRQLKKALENQLIDLLIRVSRPEVSPIAANIYTFGN